MDYVVIAEFRAAPGKRQDFLDLLKTHVPASRAEPGCRTFDACLIQEDPDFVLLYEVYDNEEAYLAHRATDHYARFRKLAPDLLDQSTGEIFLSRRVLERPF